MSHINFHFYSPISPSCPCCFHMRTYETCITCLTCPLRLRGTRLIYFRRSWAKGSSPRLTSAGTRANLPRASRWRPGSGFNHCPLWASRIWIICECKKALPILMLHDVAHVFARSLSQQTKAPIMLQMLLGSIRIQKASYTCSPQAVSCSAEELMFWCLLHASRCITTPFGMVLRSFLWLMFSDFRKFGFSMPWVKALERSEKTVQCSPKCTHWVICLSCGHCSKDTIPESFVLST